MDERQFELGEGARFLEAVSFGDAEDAEASANPGSSFACVDLLRGQLWITTGRYTHRVDPPIPGEPVDR